MTGASRGIGRTIAKTLSQNGYRVVATAKSHMDDEDNLKYLSLDMTLESSHFQAVNYAVSVAGGLDLYVNNVGRSEWRSINNIDEAFLKEIFTLNTFSYFYGCKAASSVMVNGGSIINISSIAGRRGSKNNSVYSASKFAITGITQSLAKELGPRGIRVNSICPVLISTPGLLLALQEPAAPGHVNVETFLQTFAEDQSALQKLPEASDVAELCLYLASEHARSITGQSINVDCGVFPS